MEWPECRSKNPGCLELVFMNMKRIKLLGTEWLRDTMTKKHTSLDSTIILAPAREKSDLMTALNLELIASQSKQSNR